MKPNKHIVKPRGGRIQCSNKSFRCVGNQIMLELFNSFFAKPNVFILSWNSFARDMPVDTHTHINLSQTFAMSIWLPGTGGGGVKLVVSVSSLLCTWRPCTTKKEPNRTWPAANLYISSLSSLILFSLTLQILKNKNLTDLLSWGGPQPFSPVSPLHLNL